MTQNSLETQIKWTLIEQDRYTLFPSTLFCCLFTKFSTWAAKCKKIYTFLLDFSFRKGSLLELDSLNDSLLQACSYDSNRRMPNEGNDRLFISGCRFLSSMNFLWTPLILFDNHNFSLYRMSTIDIVVKKIQEYLAMNCIALYELAVLEKVM